LFVGLISFYIKDMKDISTALQILFSGDDWLSAGRLNYFIPKGIELIFGSGCIDGTTIHQSIQAGAWDLSTNFLSITDSFILWILKQFGLIGLFLYLSFFINIIFNGIRNKCDIEIILIIVYILVSSVKLYPLIEKSSYLLAFFFIGIIRGQILENKYQFEQSKKYEFPSNSL